MFEVGQKVLCIDDKPRPRSYSGGRGISVRAGSVYTIAKVFPAGRHNAEGVYVAEADCGAPHGYYADRFRAIDDKDDAIEVFRQMTRKTVLPVSEERLKDLLKDVEW